MKRALRTDAAEKPAVLYDICILLLASSIGSEALSGEHVYSIIFLTFITF